MSPCAAARISGVYPPNFVSICRRGGSAMVADESPGSCELRCEVADRRLLADAANGDV